MLKLLLHETMCPFEDSSMEPACTPRGPGKREEVLGDRRERVAWENESLFSVLSLLQPTS